jgi:hypothetical protein
MTDIFTRDGITWRRQWVGDNSGRYEWTSDDNRLVVWREHKDYSATLDGYPSTKTWPTLTAAMAASVKGRDALNRRRAG